MRLISVKTPEGKGAQVAELALGMGIPQVSTYSVYVHGKNRRADVVQMELSTPEAKAFVEDLVRQPYYNAHDYSITVRGVLSHLSARDLKDFTHPVCMPPSDIAEDLWQFNHITYSLVGRILCAGLLLAYGMLEDNLLLMIGGLLFMPLLPMTMAMALGSWTSYWRLARQGLQALLVSAVVLVIAGATVALLHGGPLQFQKFSPIHIGVLLSLVVAVASTLGSADDVGRRELIGLAAASQVGILPTWLGIALVLGGQELAKAPERLLSLGLNVVTLVLVSAIVYPSLGVKRDAIQRWVQVVTRGDGKREAEA